MVERSTTPFCDAARVLLAEGVDPVTVGTAAGLTVADDTGGKPVFRTWKPYDAGSAVAVASPMRQNESPAVHRASTRTGGRPLTGSSVPLQETRP